MIKYLLVGRRLAGPRCHAHDYCVRARSLTPPGWWHIHLIWAPKDFCGTSFINNLFYWYIYYHRMWEQYANANGLGHHLQHCIKIRQAHPAHFSRIWISVCYSLGVLRRLVSIESFSVLNGTRASKITKQPNWEAWLRRLYIRQVK